MLDAMIRAAERWRAMEISDFERRRMAAFRLEIDQVYEAQNGLIKRPAVALCATGKRPHRQSTR